MHKGWGNHDRPNSLLDIRLTVLHNARLMARTLALGLADRILNGTLETELRHRRQSAESFENIARWLAIEHDIDVTSATVRRWCIYYGIEDAVAS